MSDDLRTRIAAALTGYVDHGHRYDLADMLIRELGLTRRTGQGPFSNQVWYETDWTIE